MKGMNLIEEQFECPCPCENCGRIVELEDLWPHPNDESWIGGTQELRFCRTCYEKETVQEDMQ